VSCVGALKRAVSSVAKIRSGLRGMATGEERLFTYLLTYLRS
jgi:hypothetical protein